MPTRLRQPDRESIIAFAVACLRSRAVIGGLVTLVLAVLSIAGYRPESATVEAAAWDVAMAAAAMLTIWGRIGAVRAIPRPRIGRMDESDVGVIAVVVVVLAATMTGGCANVPISSATDDAVQTSLTGYNLGRFRTLGDGSPDGKVGPAMDLVTQASPPTLIMADETGFRNATTGVGSMLNVPGVGQMWTPSTLKVKKLTVKDPSGRTTLEAEDLAIDSNSQAATWAAQIATIAGDMKEMNRDEAKRYVDSLVAAGQITADVAKAVIAAYFPTTAITAPITAPATTAPR